MKQRNATRIELLKHLATQRAQICDLQKENTVLKHNVYEQARLEKEILVVAEREKEHLGRELHDGLCQTLTGITALSLTLVRTINDNGEARTIACEINSLLNNAVVDARGIARGLNPVGLKDVGLQHALELLAHNTTNQFRVVCELQCFNTHTHLGKNTEKQLLRIAQEAINNSITHGFAKHITIVLRALDQKGRLSIIDDGVGLRSSDTTGYGMGLRTMNYRARQINGFLKIHSSSMGGLTVVCEFPFEH